MLASPLTALLKKDNFHWGEATDEAFVRLKQAVSSPSVLALPDFTKKFVIECDVSGKGIGAVLMQQGRPISFFSQALKGRALSLPTYEKELYSLDTAIQNGDPNF